ncbi:DUF2162 domain-containing protein [Desulfobacula phenolica]|uniref:Predicted transporter n=1 Tax=Desulfobacula phenolica TaxID=90732 RepID=A0A1H2JY89_9BACT|nr:DUF2162 domain-containing protein [Desulfobacula phenolica]SDU61434.1 Predicted transporter [Desulfobacula phenolica]
MELKSLILGLFLSTGAFAVKSGGGLSYVFLQAPGRTRQLLTTLLFMAGYGIVFAVAAAVLLNVDLMAHIDLLQVFFKSGMTLHLLLALLLLVWGGNLIKNRHEKQTSTRGWIPLVVPCPVCFAVILLSCSFVSAIYPDNSVVFFALYAGFILISLVVAFTVRRLVSNQGAAKSFLGRLMLYIAVYFILSVIVIPQFADLDKIYRISFTDNMFELSREKIILLILSISALITGFINPLKRE